MDLKVTGRCLFLLPVAVAFLACSMGRYRLWHLPVELTTTSALQWFTQFFVALFLMFILMPTIAVSVSACPGVRNKITGLSASILAMFLALILDAVSPSYGFLSGPMAQWITELPFVIGLFAVAIPLVARLRSQTTTTNQDQTAKISRTEWIISIAVISIAVCALVWQRNAIWHRLDLLIKWLAKLPAESPMKGSTWSRAFYEYPGNISGNREAIAIFLIGASAYLTIPLAFVLSSRFWVWSLIPVAVVFATAIGSYFLIYYLGAPASRTAAYAIKSDQFDAIIYVTYFFAASLLYYAFGFLTGKLVSLSKTYLGV